MLTVGISVVRGGGSVGSGPMPAVIGSLAISPQADSASRAAPNMTAAPTSLNSMAFLLMRHSSIGL